MYNPAESFSSEVLLYCNFFFCLFILFIFFFKKITCSPSCIATFLTLSFSILLKMQHFSMMDLITGLFQGNVIVPEGDAMC